MFHSYIQAAIDKLGLPIHFSFPQLFFRHRAALNPKMVSYVLNGSAFNITLFVKEIKYSYDEYAI